MSISSNCTAMKKLNSDLKFLATTGKLYERALHEKQLIEAYRRRVSCPSCRELILINGPSGTGKSALANSFRSHVEEAEKGIWIQGKFDQFYQDQPNSTFKSALNELVNAVEGRGEDCTNAARNAVATTMDLDDRHWLISSIPSLSNFLLSSPNEVLGAVVAVGNTSTPNSRSIDRNRFRRITRQFMAAVCSSLQTPVVLFLDDLQWCDPASLEMMRYLVSDTNHLISCSLIVLGTCRGDEVAIDHPLSVILRNLEDEDKATITNIRMANLSRQSIEEFIADALELPREVTHPLADIVFCQTGGNIFYAIRFMQSLHERGYLYRDPESHQWNWEEDQIRPKYDNVLHLVSFTLLQLPERVRYALKVAACMGTKFKEAQLQLVISFEVEPALAEAEDNNIIVLDQEIGEGKWIHDRWQQAAYELMTDMERSQLHLQIGRTLWNRLPSEDQENENLFLIVNQLGNGVHLITDADERRSAAILCYVAGEKAAKSSAFELAATYFEWGIGLLGQRHWRDDYNLSLSLYNAAAEVACCNGRFDRVDLLIAQVIENARNLEDQEQAFATKVYALGSHRNISGATDTCLFALRQLGVSFPRKVSKLRLLMEFWKTRRLLTGKSDNDILSLPLMVDANVKAAVSLMTIVFPFTHAIRRNLSTVMALRIVQLTLLHGLAGGSSAAGFVFYAVSLCMFGDLDGGCRYCALSLLILELFRTKEWQARVLSGAYGIILPWKTPLRVCMPEMMNAYCIGLESGDIHIAMRAGVLHNLAELCVGRPLAEVLPRMKQLHAQMKKLGEIVILPYVASCINVAISLMADRPGEVVPNEYVIEQSVVEQAGKSSNSQLLAVLSFSEQMLAFWSSDYVLVDKLMTGFGRPETKTGPSFAISVLHMFRSLSCLTLATRPKRNERLARQHLSLLRKSSALCEENRLNKVMLIEGELAVRGGRLDEAIVMFNQSIELAGRDNNIAEQALACERAGLHLRESGSLSLAGNYLERAIALYRKWGAVAKVQRISRILASDRVFLSRIGT